MISIVASAVLAAVIPLGELDSVGVAAYWYRKDSRGRGDSISEQAKPRRFPAFAIAADTFLVKDPFVRTKHLDRVELWFGDKRYPAKETARGKEQEFVVVKTERPVEGIKPLAFVDGEPAERLSWQWNGDSLGVEVGSVGTNSGVRVDVATRTAVYQGRESAMFLDKDRKPVALEFGDYEIVKGDRHVFHRPMDGGTVPVDTYEKSATAIEDKVAAASIPLLVKLEQEDKDSRSRRSWRYDDDGPSPSESDAMGYVINGRVLVKSSMTGETIARLKCVEAKFADGTRTNLVFAGALAEWNAMVFDIPGGFKDKVGSLSVSTAAPHAMCGRNGWKASVEDEAGRPVVDARKAKFCGVAFLKDAKFAPVFGSYTEEGHYYDGDRGNSDFLLTEDGAVASIILKHRFGRKYSDNESPVAPGDLIAALEGKLFNPEFRPRAENERNRMVWLGIESVGLTDALAREKKAQSFCTAKYSRPPLVTEVYAGSPAEKAGIKNGDILLSYRRGSEEEHTLESEYDYGRDWTSYFEESGYYSFYGSSSTPWSNVENGTNQELTKLGSGTKITIVYVRDGKRCEAELTLEPAPPHYRNAPKSRNRTLGLLVKDMTFEVRRYFKFDDKAPGVVIAKIKPGSPTAVAGLKVFELITEVNGEKVSGARDFAAKIRDRKDLVFAVRRLSQTRMVKIHVQ